MNHFAARRSAGSASAFKESLRSRVESAPRSRETRLHDYAPVREDFRSQVLHGLRRARKQLPCKFFYDQRGSQLFDQICDLDEYYLTRSELEILQSDAPEMAAMMGPHCRIIEYGSGSSLKTRLLLDKVESPAAYVPLDISREHLLEAAARLNLIYPGLDVLPVCADYTREFVLPNCDSASRTVIYFPGSTIGNFEPPDARDFLRSAADRAGAGGGLLIGVDLKKDPARLHAAYNDAAGVTAAFNMNLLARINRELHADFQIDRFAHYAFYNPRLGRIEMHLVSLCAQTIKISGEVFNFRDGEAIFTESSYKYTLAEFASVAQAGGWRVEKVWTDSQKQFSVQYLSVI